MIALNITHILLKAVEELNQQLAPEKRILISTDALLSDDEGPLDSLGLVNLILIVEEQVSNEFSVQISLSDEKTMTQIDNPFKSVKTLSDYVSQLIEEKQNA